MAGISPMALIHRIIIFGAFLFYRFPSDLLVCNGQLENLA